MIFWVVWLALGAQASLPAAPECALLLDGPGRTSAFDYRLNLLRGNTVYEGQSTCITYEAVDRAYLDARKRILVSQPSGDWKAEDYASVGELMLDISINLARTYGLTYEEIEKALPLIDTSRTLVREVCPPVFSHVECRAGKYRRLDGLCNNLQHPTWGSTMAPFQRLLGPLFADGINAPRISHTGRPLPPSRVVSRTMHPDEGFHDHAGTIMVIAWGQFMDHDYTLTGTPLDPRNRNDPEECCNRPPHLKHPYCNELHIPEDDYFYRLFGIKCLDFVRAFPSPRPGCRLGSRVPFNTLTGSIDGNTVYGVTDHFARKLRTGYGGLLRMNPVFEEYGLKDLLPLKLDIPDEGCTRPNKNMYCFEAGEIRVNEQLILTVMHTLMAREHNRAAAALAEVNPHWDDETLYQEARRITIAEIQHITYNEFLPILLGKEVMEKFGLVLERESYWDGYDTSVNPDVLDAFAAAAYRFGHSLLPTAVERWSKAHKFIASKRLSDLIRRPYDLYRAGVLDEYVMGLMNQVAQAMDDSITQEVTNHLFKKVGARFGMDLVSLNMQRGREFGLPGYMEFRKFCGLPPANNFNDLYGSMPNDTVRRYESIFEHPIDVDLWSGGVSERPLPGSMLGPTFACIIATQFSYSRRGDRFWYELPNQPSSFSPEQLAEVRKARLARVICDNTDIIDTVQLYPMVLPDHELNPRVPCRSGIIPSIDFSKWAEPAPFHGTAKQFITEASVFSNNSTSGPNNTSVTSNEAPKPTPNNEELSVNESSYNETLNQTTSNTANTIDSQVLLKYLDKQDNNISESGNKFNGNTKNTLKRKKRSNADNSEEASRAPLIVDYKTSHGSGEIGKEIRHQPVQFQRNVQFVPRKQFITGAADFNIKTIHDYSDPIKNHPTLNYNDDKSESVEIESGENKAPKNRLKSDESDSNEFTNERLKGSNNSINNKSKSGNYNNNKRKQDDSDERENENNHTKDNDYSKESRHESENDSKEKVHHRKYDSSGESGEKIPQSKEKYYNNDSEEDTSKRGESSSESDDELQSKKSNKLYKKIGSAEDTEIHSSKSTENENSNKKGEIQNISDNYYNNESSEKYSDSKRNTQSKDITRDKTGGDSSTESDDEKSNKKRRIYYNNDSEESDNDSSSTEKSTRKGENSDDENSSSSSETNNNKSNENSDSAENNDNRAPQKDNIKLLSNPIQDVDIGDFSYERIKINDKGHVEPSKEAKENYEEASNENSHVKINVGEVRPVVEISHENDSSESSEDKPSQDNSGYVSQGDVDVSEETFAKIKQSNNEKLPAGKSVKQEFERIPLNYNHDQNKATETPQSSDSSAPKTHLKPDNNKNNVNEETTTTGYDDNLNHKFNYPPLKLPEINLPQDILNFEYEAPNPVFDYTPYKYQHEEKKDDIKNSDDHDSDSDDDHDYPHSETTAKPKDGYKNSAYKDYERDEEKDEEEEEDLYEKFVRERFGKQDSFEKRSERLEQQRYEPLDNHLFKTIDKLLKKADETSKQAEQSGDPKAGYIWTLEYGQNLN